MSNTKIIQFSIDHYAEVFSLWQTCDGIGLSEADSRKSIRAYLDRNPGLSFVAFSDDRLVGAVLAGHDGRRGYIHHLAVQSDWRRKGLARRLVDACLHSLADLGLQKCHIFLFNDNADGKTFWKAIGWTIRADIGVVSKNIDPQAN